MSDVVGFLFALAAILGLVMVAGGSRCTFRQCRWIHYCNVVMSDDSPCGLYQCSRCKTLSIGKLQRVPKSW